MARIYPICSSSSGNSTFIGTRGHGILVDAGCSFKALKNALELIGVKPDIKNIEAVFITHAHIDHIKAVEQLIKHTNIPVFATRETENEMKETDRLSEDISLYNAREGYHSASFEMSCFDTSHDAAGSVGYIVRYNGERYGICTDTGYVTEAAEKALKGCKTVLLESNHDEQMLRMNPRYHAALKRRILSNEGHLSNAQCAEFAVKLVKTGTRHLILGHLSKENNTPETARAETLNALIKSGFKEERDFTLNIAPVMTTGEYITQ